MDQQWEIYFFKSSRQQKMIRILDFPNSAYREQENILSR
jgi:hypothetical protein